MAVMAFAGMSVAQDIYYSGYYTGASGVTCSAVYKNNTRLYQNGIVVDYFYGQCPDLDVHNGDVWWVDNHYNTDGDTPREAKLFKNNFQTNLNFGETANVNDLQRSINGTYLFAMGSKTYQGFKTAWFWRNTDSSSNTDGTQIGTSFYVSEAFGAAEYDGYMYMCGYQYTNSSTFHGVIWNGSTEVKAFDSGTKIYDMV